jgi:hypothetical protein
MPKLNEGDIMEGIFCLATGLYLAYDKIDKAKLNVLRLDINPQNFIDSREQVMIVKDHVEKLDLVSVECVIRLKASSTRDAFGSDYRILYEHQKDIGDIDKKIQNLVKNIETSNFGSRLLELKHKYVKNNTKELLYFRVVADGIAGEVSGGEIKSDVEITLEVRDAKKKLIATEKIPFSIKSKSKTLSNLSPFNGMKKIAASFHINDAFIEKYRPIFEERATTSVQKEATNKAISAIYNELTTLMVKKSKDKNFSKYAVDFISKEVFGSDLADLIDIDNTKIKEIPKKLFDSFVKTMEFEAIKSGNYIKVMLKGSTKMMLFSTRIKIRTSSSGAVERKFYIEAGNLLYKG